MSRFIDAPLAERCTHTITLRDGSRAQCGRRGREFPGGPRLCAQHARIVADERFAEESERAAQENAKRFREICMTCKVVLQEGDAGAEISHGICDACFTVQMAQLDSAQATGRSLATDLQEDR